MADTVQTYTMQHSGEQIDAAVDTANAAVPATRTVNGKALGADISLTAADVGAVTKSDLLSCIYPVGSIYMSVNSTSPAAFLGGTWVALSDTFLYCAGGNTTAGSTGGARQLTLKRGNLPPFEVKINAGFSGASDSLEQYDAYINSSSWTQKTDASGPTQGVTRPTFARITAEDGNAAEPLDVMPPYLAVYVWKRTA